MKCNVSKTVHKDSQDTGHHAQYPFPYGRRGFARGQEFINVSDFVDPLDSMLASGDAKRITWTVRAGIPIYKVESSKKTELFKAATGSPFVVDESVCRRMAEGYLTRGTKYSVSFIEEYEPGFSSVRKSRMRTLPVYKVSVADDFSSSFYIVPETAKPVYTNDNSNIRNTLYTTLHSLNCSYFYSHPLLREVLLWLLMLGGTVVSLTGVILGYRYIMRKAKSSK